MSSTCVEPLVPAMIPCYVLQVQIKEPYDTSSVTKAHPDVPSGALERVVKMVRALLGDNGDASPMLISRS